MLTFEMVREAKQNWPKSKLAEVEIGRSRNWPKSKLAEVELAELEKKNWPKSKLAEVDHDPSSLASTAGSGPGLIITFAVTRPASRQTLATALSKAHPRPAKTPARAHAAWWWPQESSGRPHRKERAVQGERKTKSAKEDHPEQLGWDFRESSRRACGQCQPNSRPSLGPDHGHPGCVNSCEDVTVPEVRFDTRGCLMLPALQHPGSKSSGSWDAGDSLCQSMPSGRNKIEHSGQLPCR